MFLDYIEITNFRPYYGTQKIEFGYNTEENLTIILANNGSGKTSLVNALTWCLYGEELHDMSDKTEPLYNLKAAREVEDESISGAKVTVSVKINFYYFEKEGDEEVKKYFTVYRELNYQKFGTAEWQPPFDSYLIVEESGNEILEDEYAALEINNKIPQDMFQYFFFNGASLVNYFKDDSDLSLKNSIEEISQIDLINVVSKHLSSTYTTINNKLKSKKPKGKNYSALIEQKINEKQNKQDEKTEKNGRIETAMNNIIKYQTLLDKVDSEEAKKLNAKRIELENQLKSVKESIKDNTKEYESLIIDLFPLVILFDELVESKNIAEDAKEKKTAPPEIEADLLNDILEDGYCICGIKLEEHPECVDELQKRLKNTSRVKRETFYEEYYAIKNVIKRLKELPKIESLRNNINVDVKTRDTLDIQIKDIDSELASFDIEEVERIEEQLQKNKKNKEKLEGEVERLISDIKDLENEIKQLQGERDREENLKGELKILSEKVKFCENAMNSINDLRDNVKKYIISKVNNQLKEQFLGIKWQYDKFTDVTIRENYQIQVTKKSGSQISPADLSDGEESLLALSFMMALHSLSGFEIPLIIDAPFEKLDKGKKIEFVKGLHDFTKEKQIVFLLTDSQYTDEVRAIMKKNIVDEYELKPAEDKTEIVKHG